MGNAPATRCTYWSIILFPILEFCVTIVVCKKISRDCTVTSSHDDGSFPWAYTIIHIDRYLHLLSMYRFLRAPRIYIMIYGIQRLKRPANIQAVPDYKIITFQTPSSIFDYDGYIFYNFTSVCRILNCSFRTESLRDRYDYILMQHYEIIMRSSAPAWRGLSEKPLELTLIWELESAQGRNNNIIISSVSHNVYTQTHTHTHTHIRALAVIACASRSKNTLVYAPTKTPPRRLLHVT